MSSPHLLTGRDRAILTMVYAYDGVLIAHIRRRFFRSKGAKSPCYRRVGMLVDAGYLAATRLPARGGTGSGPLFYALGTAGRPVLAEFLGLLPSELARASSAVTPLFAAHHAAVCDTRLSLDLATEPFSPVRLRSWRTERELKRAPLRLRDPLTHTIMPVVPDGAFTLVLADGRAQQAYLEQDMGTVAAHRMRTKLRLYLSQEHGSDPLPILLVVTTTPVRQEALCCWVLEEAAGLRTATGASVDPTRVLLTTADSLTEHTVLSEPIWQVAGGASAFALLPPDEHPPTQSAHASDSVTSHPAMASR